MRTQNIFMALVASFGICFALQAEPIGGGTYDGYDPYSPSEDGLDSEMWVRVGCLDMRLTQHTTNDLGSEEVANQSDTPKPKSEPSDVAADQSNAPSRRAAPGLATRFWRLMGYAGANASAADESK